MTDRDALVKLIRDSDAWMLGHEQDLADEILAAGWRAPEPSSVAGIVAQALREQLPDVPIYER